ncbi:ABC transporter substrate-binding protein [Qingshengfaniella alkalisoli]|uniref:ABC transporter substrate-binding protein n=1 Tax=Qingshengfaniella alkalisoli TaxID=2599296 RepID=A0A5B8J7Q4_9RHOB|nr:ABC transporter substrate-binding protein [Qingshengfaniella alkalisoli]QDY70507.1 ABC transporter substrate-binding protein [Qingshengfaniella alkalisoli]
MKFLNTALTGVSLSLAFTTMAHANGNDVTWATSTDIPTLDPYAFASTSALAFQNHIYEGLVGWNADFEIEPVLAESYEYTDDTTIRFKLREGVTFHDGAAFTADDVVASVNRATNENAGIRGNVSTIASAEKIDDYTVDIKLAEQSPIAINELTGLLIMDQEWLEANRALEPTSMSAGTEGYATNNANGTGPFSLVSRRRDVAMELAANPDWWNNENKTHNIDTITFKPVTSDATRLAGLLSGEYTLVTDVPLQDLERLEANDSLEVKVSPTLRVNMFSLNMDDELNAGNVDGKNPLQDVRVRQAMMMALDREAITQKIMRGMSEPANSYIAPAIVGFDEANQIDLAYDPEGAKALLEEAGYGDGFKLAFDCVEGAYLNARQWCQAAQAFWARIGIEAELNVHPRSTYSQIRDNGRTDIGVLGWANLPLIDAYSINQQLIHSKDGGIYGAFNIPRYKNEEVDSLIEASAVEMDQEKRKELIGQVMAKSQADLPFIPMHYEPVAWVSKTEFGVPIYPDNVVRLWRAGFE